MNEREREISEGFPFICKWKMAFARVGLVWLINFPLNGHDMHGEMKWMKEEDVNYFV